MKSWLVAALLLLLMAGEAEALVEPELCYVLDAVLFLYGIVLTILYCRLKMQVRKLPKVDPSAVYETKGEAIYTGLTTRDQETYETLEPKGH
ncbi:high affinity immunoglobulin epsilon receptor subunit gamma [Alligator sinensis]|uniref:high affinity immunoglobulin epsilon receptor subunit gamma n=1 Tax=Alligator sinensis TaxID=38654 RepID=UPI0003C29198|nr:high affinity immunoglobulin epsilon receptor subunit gamma [Alligator sinensis]